jgi:hypothetical protein
VRQALTKQLSTPSPPSSPFLPLFLLKEKGEITVHALRNAENFSIEKLFLNFNFKSVSF